jgi:hypothetical protein
MNYLIRRSFASSCQDTLYLDPYVRDRSLSLMKHSSLITALTHNNFYLLKY